MHQRHIQQLQLLFNLQQQIFITNMDKLKGFVDSERAILKGLAKRIVDKLSNTNVNIHTPDGGFYIFPDFSQFIRSID